jgi:hypothetical protein
MLCWENENSREILRELRRKQSKRELMRLGGKYSRRRRSKR